MTDDPVRLHFEEVGSGPAILLILEEPKLFNEAVEPFLGAVVLEQRPAREPRSHATASPPSTAALRT